MVERDTVTPGTVTRRRRWQEPRVRLGIVGVLGALGTALLLTLLGPLAPGGSSRSSTALPKTLPTAKPFTLPALGRPGQSVSLSAYNGKPLIVNFFASWCTPCQQETPLIARYYRTMHGRLAIIGVDVNDPSASALTFVHADGVAYPVGVDAGTAPTATAYGLDGLPQTFFLNAQHKIVKRVVGAVTLSELKAGTAMIDPSTK